jgi:hypothetical protein
MSDKAEKYNRNIRRVIFEKHVLKKPLCTENCIVCFKKAIVYSGHVHKGFVKITAGFCHEHRFKTISHDNCHMGCKGEYQKQMGTQMMYIG